MSRLQDSTQQARRGRALRQVPGVPQDPCEPPVELSVPQRHDLIDLWCQLMTDLYVHHDQKKALYGYDPVRALLALRRQIPYLGSAEFLRELTLVINRLRDQHTQLYLHGPDPRRRSYVATLPFLVEVYGEHLSPDYVVTKVSDPRDGFVPGVRVTTWNGIPFSRAVDLYADTLTGGRPDARRARALETLTQRPLAFLPQPDELWVDIGYRELASTDGPDRSIRFEWRAIEPSTASAGSDTVQLRTRRAVDAISETARRSRKLLFQPVLWQQETAGVERVARASEWMQTALPDAISAREVPTSHGVVGYLRLWTFDVSHSDEFLDEVDRVLRAMPPGGLVVDVRSNPGGVIEVAERLLQLFTTKPVQPVRFALRATPAVAALAEADGNGADLADWAASVRTAMELGEGHSQHLPISDPDRCNGRAVAYSGPVVVVVDPTTFSSGDIFAAGMADHAIGQIVSVGAGTGAGGANVWTHDDIEYAYHVAGLPLPPRPPGIGYSVSVRRATRSGAAAGLAIEDIGVSGEEQYTMTERDVLGGNEDLIEFCARLLAEC
ncbi:S41 family peptidase [Cellulomonas sp. URHE0023]|uniref:S41 family peptidase n=1 Tax=Cellulomonas sp. URHE0023 TaxID=1380354 RepID=UPI00068DD837|nr:S41 family peptidase [Cellulomonas sp. URHE0023]